MMQYAGSIEHLSGNNRSWPLFFSLEGVVWVAGLVNDFSTFE